MTPPRIPTLLLRWLIPRELVEPITGDLEEEWRAWPRRSRRRYWSLAVRSILACWVDQVRRDGPDRHMHSEPFPTGDGAMQSLLQDLRYGARLMWRNPGFSLAAVITLALGIGANSAIFSIVHVLLIEPMPYHDPERVAFVLGWDVEENEMRFSMRHADLLDLQQQATTFASIGAYSYLSANLTGGDIPERVQAYRLTPGMFPLLGVRALVGRTFDEAEVAAGGLDLAVISHGLWQRRFGGDPAIVGRPIVVNGQPHAVIGVMPPRFEFPVFNFKGDLWLPWQMRESERGQANAADSTTIVGRLRPGVSYAEAQAELDTLMRGFAERYPETNRGIGARLVEIGRMDDEFAGPAVAILVVTVGMVLVLACANVANLLLARGASRQRELAVRAAIGASRMRIGRQLLIEGVLLAFIGGGLGVLLAFFALDTLRATLPEVLLTTVPNIHELGVNRATLGYTLVVSLVTSLMFGVLPAWRASRHQLGGALHESASAGGSRGARRLRTALVVAEVALATMLLVTAGLLTRSYSGLQQLNPGFEPSGVMTMALTLPEYRYPGASQRRQFFEALIDRVAQLPGVTSAGVVNVLPFSTYDRGTRIVIEGAAPPDPTREPSTAYRVASTGYYQTLRIPLLAGRLFDERDTPQQTGVVIINEAFAARYFADSSPLGRRIRVSSAEDTPWLTVVGVIGDVRHAALTERPQPEIHVPLAQAPAAMMMLAVRSATRPDDLTASIRAAIRAIDPTQPVYHVKTLQTLVDDSTLPSRTSAALVMLFSTLALVLAAVGVYGVVAYGVSQQTREFGVRLALGATPRDLLRQVLRSGCLMVGVGMVVGVAGALGAAQLLGSLLFGVTPADPLTYAVVIAVLAATGLLACAVPAWRASTVKPMSALRTD